MGGSGGVSPGLELTTRPNLDEITKINPDALTGEIIDNCLAVAFKCAVEEDIAQIRIRGGCCLCLESIKELLARGHVEQTIQAYAYVRKMFSCYWSKEKDTFNTYKAKYALSEIEMELVQYFLNASYTNLAIKIAEKMMATELKAKASLKIFLSQKAGTNGGPYR